MRTKHLRNKPNGPPMLPDRPWYKTGMAVIGMSTAIAGLVALLLTLPEKAVFGEEIPGTVFQLLVDTSSDSVGPIQGATKQGAIAVAVSNVLTRVAENDGAALRTFGGECAQGTERRVPLRTKNRERIMRAIDGIEFAGERTLVRGLVEAAAELGKDKFKNKNKRLIVITGGGDACLPHAEAARELRARKTETGLTAEIILLGIGVPRDRKEALKDLADSLGGTTLFADSLSELHALSKGLVSAKSVASVSGNSIDAAAPTNRSLPPVLPSSAESSTNEHTGGKATSVAAEQEREASPLPAPVQINESSALGKQQKADFLIVVDDHRITLAASVFAEALKRGLSGRSQLRVRKIPLVAFDPSDTESGTPILLSAHVRRGYEPIAIFNKPAIVLLTKPHTRIYNLLLLRSMGGLRIGVLTKFMGSIRTQVGSGHLLIPENEPVNLLRKLDSGEFDVIGGTSELTLSGPDNHVVHTYFDDRAEYWAGEAPVFLTMPSGIDDNRRQMVEEGLLAARGTEQFVRAIK